MTYERSRLTLLSATPSSYSSPYPPPSPSFSPFLLLLLLILVPSPLLHSLLQLIIPVPRSLLPSLLTLVGYAGIGFLCPSHCHHKGGTGLGQHG